MQTLYLFRGIKGGVIVTNNTYAEKNIVKPSYRRKVRMAKKEFILIVILTIFYNI